MAQCLVSLEQSFRQRHQVFQQRQSNPKNSVAPPTKAWPLVAPSSSAAVRSIPRRIAPKAQNSNIVLQPEAAQDDGATTQLGRYVEAQKHFAPLVEHLLKYFRRYSFATRAFYTDMKKRVDSDSLIPTAPASSGPDVDGDDDPATNHNLYPRSAHIDWKAFHDCWRMGLDPYSFYHSANGKQPLYALTLSDLTPEEQFHLDMELGWISFHLRTTLVDAFASFPRKEDEISVLEDARFPLLIMSAPILRHLRQYPLAGALRISPSAQRFVSQSGGRAPQSLKRGVSTMDVCSIDEKSLERTRTQALWRALGLLVQAPATVHKCLVKWFAHYPETEFRSTVDLLRSLIRTRLKTTRRRRWQNDDFPGTNDIPGELLTVARRSASDDSYSQYPDDWKLNIACTILELFVEANQIYRIFPASRPSEGGPEPQGTMRCQLLPSSAFVIRHLADGSFDPHADFKHWRSHQKGFMVSKYPFLLPFKIKVDILQRENHRIKWATQDAAEQAYSLQRMRSSVSVQVLKLNVRRQYLLEDSLKQILGAIGAAQGELKLDLKIRFAGEEGVDGGGLRKEWFLELVKDLFKHEHIDSRPMCDDPRDSKRSSLLRVPSNNDLFIFDDDSNICYFNPALTDAHSARSTSLLAPFLVWQSTTASMSTSRCPRSCSKSSCPKSPHGSQRPRPPGSRAWTSSPPGSRRSAQTLHQILHRWTEYGEPAGLYYTRCSQRNSSAGQHTIEFPLCDGGEQRPVTRRDRHEFVRLYMQHMLSADVDRPFAAFKRGFFDACGTDALMLFRGDELDLVLRGSPEPLDIAALRAAAAYENCAATEPFVDWFWSWWGACGKKKQRDVLRFVTGSDRVPATGCSGFVLKVLCLSREDEVESDRLPESSTCTNAIKLWRYGSREVLEEKLTLAVAESEGFGLR